MSEPSTPPNLLDLRMMPAWVNEPAQPRDYSEYEGEDEKAFERGGRGPRPGREGRARGPKRDDRQRDNRGKPERRDGRRGPQGDQREPRRDEQRGPRPEPMPLPQVDVRFLPHATAFENVIAQIKAGSVTYSVFALARLFLDKPERYDVRLKAAEGAVLYQLGEHGPASTDARSLEAIAFASAKEDFYTIERVQSEPIKGNFSNVARCRLSGTLLGPTNHHAYQPQLRSLYEQRFSRRMSFQDYQRQIEIVSDPAVVEQWKEEARSVTTYETKGEEPATKFSNAAEAERHFRQNHLPSLVRSAQEITIGGVLSRRLADRGLGRVIENAWAAETRSPSKMMQELSAGLRQAGLNIFRHRRGMLFVSPFRMRPFGHERTGVSASINRILETLAEAPGTNRKQLAEKMTAAEGEAGDVEKTKRTLASDLHWLIHEGYVIEFNDGTLELPRAKAAPPAATQPEAATGTAQQGGVTENVDDVGAEVSSETTRVEEIVPAPEATAETFAGSESAGGGGMSVEQTIAPRSDALEAGGEGTEPSANPPSQPSA